MTAFYQVRVEVSLQDMNELEREEFDRFVERAPLRASFFERSGKAVLWNEQTMLSEREIANIREDLIGVRPDGKHLSGICPTFVVAEKRSDEAFLPVLTQQGYQSSRKINASTPLEAPGDSVASEALAEALERLIVRYETEDLDFDTENMTTDTIVRGIRVNLERIGGDLGDLDDELEGRVDPYTKRAALEMYADRAPGVSREDVDDPLADDRRPAP